MTHQLTQGLSGDKLGKDCVVLSVFTNDLSGPHFTTEVTMIIIYRQSGHRSCIFSKHKLSYFEFSDSFRSLYSGFLFFL